MPNRSRQKGDRAERELRDILRMAGHHVRKIPSSGAGADFKGDLLVGDEGQAVTWEVKVRNNGFSRIYAWLIDASVLAFRAMGRQGHNEEWIVTLRLNDLLRMVKDGKL